MQRPLLKDGVVINVIEIDENTLVVCKAEHKQLQAEEDAAYTAQLEEWRAVIKARQGELGAASERLGMAKMTLSAMKVKVAEEKGDARAALALKQILSMEADVEQNEQAVMALHARPIPAKPKLVRSTRWIRPDDCEIGPAGGNIGDRWDGKQYVRPEKVLAEAAAK